LIDQTCQEIHRGRLHLVQRVRAPDGGRHVVKSILDDVAQLTLAVERLRNEHALLAMLDLPGVVKTLGLREQAGLPALLLEDVGNLNLKQWQRHRPLPIAQFLKLAIAITEATVGLHERSIIHGDLNPANIVIAGNERITLVDFETAVHMAGAGHHATPGDPMEGTLPYVAPERTGRMNRPIDQRADLYSLGATFYEMLVGTPPFAVIEDPVDLVHAHVARTPVAPNRANPKVPDLLSDLVLRLLAKMPEERYQSAASLLSDLRQCQARLQSDAKLPSFELGLADVTGALPLPDRLYGRNEAQAQLEAAWQQVLGAGRAVVVITGEAGVGKSTLMQSLSDPVQASGGQLALGKFDLRQGHTPYAPLVQALRGLLTNLTAAPVVERAWVRRRLIDALGMGAPVLTNLLPELADLIASPEAPAPAQRLTTVPVAESDQRFLHEFVSLVRALASPEHPLVLCVDDLQWADDASLRLLEHLVGVSDLPGFMLVACCRPDATKPPHPASRTIAALRGAAGMVTLQLGPLGPDDLQALCCDAFGRDPATTRPLTDLLLRKTGGNPFFCRRLLGFLQQRQLLTLDPDTGRWSWDLRRIEEVGVTDNIAELLVQAVAQLPATVQGTLSDAACVGSRVSVSLLAAVRREDVAITAEALWLAAREGLLVPVDAGPTADPSLAEFQFAHDRIQQACYGLVDEQARAAVHLRIGRELGAQLPSAGHDQGKIFAAADQLVLGATQVVDPGERMDVAQLLERAGARARAASAYGPALQYLGRAIKMLPRDAWTNLHQFAADLHRQAMVCAFVTDEPGLGEVLFDVALARAWSRAEKAQLYVLRIDARIARRALAEAAELTTEALRMFGLELADGPAPEMIAAELALVETNLAGRSMDDLLDGPLMQNADDLAYMQLLQRGQNTIYFLQPALFPFLVARTVNLSLRHGNAVTSAQGYVSYAVLLQRIGGDYARALGFAQLGIALAERLGDPIQLCRTVGVFAAVVTSWLEPLQSRIPLFRRVQASGIEAGEYLFAASFAVTIVVAQFHSGVELSRVLVELEGALASPHVNNVETERDLLLAYRQVVFRLSGLAPDGACIEPDGGVLGTCRHEILRLGASYLMRDLAEARALATSSLRLLQAPSRALFVVEHNFYTSLTLAALCDQATGPEKVDLLAQIALNQSQLATWSRNAPHNYQQKHLLVAAEQARVEGRSLEAAELFEQAIEAAAKQRFLQDEALAHELAGRFHHNQGRQRFARQYLSNAVAGYRRWGAKAKAEALEEEFLDLPTAATSAHQSQTPPSSEALDHVTLLRVAEALSREVVLERLTSRLMEICFATAGAERGALVLQDNDRMILRATGSIVNATTLCMLPVTDSQHVPLRVIERVFATTRPLVLADAARHPDFRHDPYLAKHEVRSLLALPILRPDKLLGVLYLENNLATRVFTPDRLQMLQLLSAQIATALENSLLFERLTQQIEERKRAEAAVRFLADAGAALSESLDYHATLVELTRLAVPSLADWCIVDVVAGDKLQRVASAHVDPEQQSQLRLGDHGEEDSQFRRHIAHVLSTRSPLLYDEVPTPQGQPAAAHEGRSEPPGPPPLAARSTMVLPLVARGRSLGVISLVSASSRHRFTATDLSLAQELARRAAVAIDNARLYGEMQEAVRLRDEFLSIASHELNTPIASLSLVVQGLVETHQVVSGELLARTVQIVARQTRRLKTLIGDLLDLAHIHTGQLRLRCSEVDLAGVLTDTLDRFSEDLIRARCSVEFHAPSGVVGQWDRSRLEQVVSNLLSNAIKFSPGKPIEITAWGDEAKGIAQLVIEDHGIGIAAESLPHIFERFARAVPSANYGGLGLGLYIVQEIVQAHGGTVTVHSMLGAGCKFTVELPLVQPEDGAHSTAEPDSDATATAAPGGLLVQPLPSPH
jgi:predicted ATPase/signal transduction histidine kinase